MVKRLYSALLVAMMLVLVGCAGEARHECHDLPNSRLETLTRHTNIDPVRSAAVASSDHDGMYIVAVRFTRAGHDGSREYVGIWSTSSLDDDLGYESLNTNAKRYSQWTDARRTGVTMSDHAIRRANRCVLPDETPTDNK